MGVFTRKRISVDSVLGGKCEQPGMARVIISASDERAARVVEHLRRVHDVVEIELLEEMPVEAYALLVGEKGRKHIAGSQEEVQKRVESESGARFVMIYDSL